MNDRRTFLTNAFAAALGATPAAQETQPSSGEVETRWVQVPSGATLWCLVAFMVDQPVELTIKAGKTIETVRGRFDGKRLAQYSWRNTSSRSETVGVRAKALAGDRELPPMRLHFISTEGSFVGFGIRGTQADASDRRGGYPYEAVLFGLIVYDA